MQDESTMPVDPPLPPDLSAHTPGVRVGPTQRPRAAEEPSDLNHILQYRVREVVGRGGMGSVLKVDDPKLARTVALKTMSLRHDATEVLRGRFLREATVLARLAHPNIVPIYDLGNDSSGNPSTR